MKTPNKGTKTETIYFYVKSKGTTTFNGNDLCRQFECHPSEVKRVFSLLFPKHQYKLIWDGNDKHVPYCKFHRGKSAEVLRDVAENGYDNMRALGSRNGLSAERVRQIFASVGFDPSNIVPTAKIQAILGLTQLARDAKLEIYKQSIASTLRVSPKLVSRVLGDFPRHHPYSGTWKVGNQASTNSLAYKIAHRMLSTNSMEITAQEIVSRFGCTYNTAVSTRNYVRLIIRVLDDIVKPCPPNAK